MSIARRFLRFLLLGGLLALAATAYALPGDLDPTFGSGGLVGSNPGGGFWGALAGLIDPLGRIVAVGEGGLRDVAVTRYLADGTLDSSFGSGGLVTIDVPPGTTTLDVAWAVVRQPDGKLVVAGEGGATRSPIVARLNDDGTLDGGFGAAGLASAPVAGLFYTVVLQPDGRIIAAGSGNEDLFVARFASDGTLDPTFGSGGMTSIDLGSEYDTARSVHLIPDGRIVAIGSGGTDEESEGIAVGRYLSDGTLDPTFGSGGVVVIEDRGRGFAGALQPNGKILATSSIPVAIDRDEIAVTRLDADGQIDATFGDAGMFHTTVESPLAQPIYYPRAVAQPDGTVLLVGSLSFNSSVIFRLGDDGTPDVSFGDGGSRVFSGRYVWSLAPQPADLKIVGFGAVTSGGSDWDFGLVRLEGGCPPGPDGDGDGIPDACDPCTNPTDAGRSKLKLSRLGSPAGDDVLSVSLSGTVPTSPPIDPAADGVRLVVRDATGRTRVDARFASLAAAQIFPPVAGIGRVRVKIRPNGTAKVRMTGHSGTYTPGELPLTMTVVLDPPMTASGQCLEAAFAPGDCTETSSGVLCRRSP